MKGKRLFLMLAAGALLLLQFVDCMSAMTPDPKSMQCCGSMPCTPAHQSVDCCKTMASPQIVNMRQPEKPVSLHAPTIEAIENSGITELVRSTPLPLLTVETQLHSP